MMDFVLPYGVLSPSSMKPRMIKRRNNKQSKLSLKNRTNATSEGKENVLPKSKTGRNEVKLGTLDLITDDESEVEASFSTRGGTTTEMSIGSTVMRESALSIPVAESTRCDANPSEENMTGTGESRTQPYYSLSRSSSSSSDSKFVTADVFPVGCNDESIICISDSEEDSPLPLKKNTNKLSSIIISSDDSDCEVESGRRSADSLNSLQKSLRTVDLGIVIPQSSESDGSKSAKRSLNISNLSPRKRSKTPSAICSSLISEDHSKVSLQCSVHMESVDASSSQKVASCENARNSICSIISSSVVDCSIISSSVVDEPHSTKALARKAMKPCNLLTILPNDSSNVTCQSGQEDSQQTDESSWKKSFKLVMPETSASVEESYKMTTPPSDGLFPPNSIDAVTLARRKHDDIERWLIKSQDSDSGESDSDFLAPSPKPKGEILGDISGTIQKKTSPAETSSMPRFWRSRRPGVDKSVDSFDAMMKSLCTKPVQSRKEVPSRSSFINDNSSTEDDSFSPSFYHRDITSTIKKEIKSVKKGIRQVQGKQLVYSSLSDSDNSDLSSDAESECSWKPDQDRRRKVNGRNKKPPSTKAKSSNSEDSGTKSEGSFDKAKNPVKSRVNKGKVASKDFSSLSDDSICDKANDKMKEVAPKPRIGIPKEAGAFETPKLKPQKITSLKAQEVPYSPIRTFLSSLSGPPRENGIRSHPEGEKYFKNFKSKKEELARRLYKLYNREVFDSRLPGDMSLEWNARMIRTAGFCYCKLTRKGQVTTRSSRIVLSTKVLTSADRLRDTLIHEMCHAAVWLLNNISGGHGPFWKAWAQKAMKRFPELPPIKTCHEYNIVTKFTYRCTSCGYSFGRHSKSLDIQRQRCGHCYGTFEVLVNKTSSKGEEHIPAEAKTSRGPNAFALFVKENYSSVKKDNALAKHGDVMKILSQKFSEVKLKTK